MNLCGAARCGRTRSHPRGELWRRLEHPFAFAFHSSFCPSHCATPEQLHISVSDRLVPVALDTPLASVLPAACPPCLRDVGCLQGQVPLRLVPLQLGCRLWLLFGCCLRR